MIVKKYKSLILIGSFLWIIGVVMAGALVYPSCFVGVYFGPIILLAGIIGWVIYYKRTKNRLPNPIYSFNNILSKHKGVLKFHVASFDFMLTYLLHMYTFIIVCSVFMVFFSNILFNSTYAFKVSKKYVESDLEVKKKIGEIKYYGFLTSGSISSNGSAEVFFSIIGENGILSAKSTLENRKVTHLKYKIAN